MVKKNKFAEELKKAQQDPSFKKDIKKFIKIASSIYQLN